MMPIKLSTSVAPKGRFSNVILSWDFIYTSLKITSSDVIPTMGLEFLTRAIGSPQGPAHYDVMSRVFNKGSKK